MHLNLQFDETVSIRTLIKYAASSDAQVGLSEDTRRRCDQGHQHLLQLMEQRLPIYGVTTGYGDSCHRIVTPDQAEVLQSNLVRYLRCGTGKILSRFSTKMMSCARLRSLSLGYSGVSTELLDQLQNLLNHDILPEVPCEGSLGASGDLIPLAYLAGVLQGEGQVTDREGVSQPASAALQKAGITPYRFKPKEGLALVNGTSAMLGVCAENYSDASFLLQTSLMSTAWLCIALRGRTDAFGDLINHRAKNHPGQRRCAAIVSNALREEDYGGRSITDVGIDERQTTSDVQDRYSLRCTPQVLGPVWETLAQLENWLTTELNSAADNPIVDPNTGELAMGGNFYGGYLGHGSDYLKISLASMADLLDRQLMTLIDDKSNRGLPPNLANWPNLAPEERHLHHGLKGLHQAVNAVTAEILNMATPNTIFSRSSELHNQDKVSMGMGSVMSCQAMMDKLYSVTAMNLICLAQALDLRGHELKGAAARELYDLVRSQVTFVDRDCELGEGISKLKLQLKALADNQKDWG